MNANTRYPAVAGMFYPGDRDELQQTIATLLANTPPPPTEARLPKALIVPHAGYIYSGPIAASAYALLQPQNQISRVVLLGPTHRIYVRGLALPDHANTWQTPLGSIPIDPDAHNILSDYPHIVFSDEAHAPEHSLEVQLPFLQTILNAFFLIPLAVGEASTPEVASILDALWGGPETLIVISSDLSHFEPYDRANAKDSATVRAILDLDTDHLSPDCACGLRPIAGLVHIARQKKLRPELLDLRNSGDTAGSRDQVVGYASFAFYEEIPQT